MVDAPIPSMTLTRNTSSDITPYSNYVYPVNELYLASDCYWDNQNIVSVDLNNISFEDNAMSSTFYNCQNLISVSNISNTVTNMADAFEECINLTTAPVIPNSVTNLSGTFTGCVNLIDAPSIPNSVTDLGSTFIMCSNLVNVPIIPNSVTYMFGTFMGCENLVNVPTIPNSVTSIARAFATCDNLVTAPNIPYSVTNMRMAFQSSMNLTGNIYIFSNQVDDAYRCFYGLPTKNLKIKNVYIPFTYTNGEYTTTYNTFIDEGYTESGVYNVYLKDLNTL